MDRIRTVVKSAELAVIKSIIDQLEPEDFSDFSEPKSAPYYTKVAYVAGRPVGFVIAFAHNERGSRVVDISVAVLREFRRHGIARSLVEEAIAFIKSDPAVRRIYWGATHDNFASLELAKSLGFTFSYKTDNYTIYAIDLEGR